VISKSHGFGCIVADLALSNTDWLKINIKKVKHELNTSNDKAVCKIFGAGNNNNISELRKCLGLHSIESLVCNHHQ